MIADLLSNCGNRGWNTLSLIAFLRRPSVNVVALVFERLFATSGFVAVCIGIAAVSSYDRYSYWRMLLIPVFGFLTTALHELGHFAGARFAGMLVISARIGPVEISPRRGLWKLRVCRPRIRTDASGYLFVIPDFSHPIQEQQVICTLGGPLANFIAATILWLISTTHAVGSYAPAWMGFAALNLFVGLANLMPNARGGTDGFQLIQLLLGQRDGESLLAYPKLIWRSYMGTTAENLPESELSELDRQPAPMPVFRKWYALKAAQNVGDWVKAAAVADSIEADVGLFDAGMIGHFLHLLDLIRTERAFSNSVVSLARLTLPDGIFATIEWYSPHLRSRCDALNAAIAGDASTCNLALEASERDAERSLDLALRESERRIRGVIREVLCTAHRDRSVDQPLPNAQSPRVAAA